MPCEHKKLLQSAFNKYLDEVLEGALEPTGSFFDYDFSFLKNRRWHMLGELMVDGDLRELTNMLNRWLFQLHRWCAWSRVVSSYDEDSKWELHNEFLEDLAHECLLRPSSLRDTFTAVATSALHQARCSADDSYADYLDGDPRNPSELAKARHLTRIKKESRLAKLVSVWPESENFLMWLRKLNDGGYKKITHDYRNLSSHTIGPRLGFGETRPVTRVICQSEEMVEMPDGSIDFVPVAGKVAVRYEFGGTPSLDFEVVRVANIEQFRVARECYMCLRHLLTVAVSAIPPLSATVDQLPAA